MIVGNDMLVSIIVANLSDKSANAASTSKPFTSSLPHVFTTCRSAPMVTTRTSHVVKDDAIILLWAG